MSTRPKAEAPAASTPSSVQKVVASTRPWSRPELIVYGDIRQLTMGPTPGVGESGNPAVFRP